MALWSKEEDRILIALHSKMLSDEQISERMKAKTSEQIGRRRKALNLKGWNNTDKMLGKYDSLGPALKRLVKTCFTYRELSRKLGCSDHTTKRLLSYHDIEFISIGFSDEKRMNMLRPKKTPTFARTDEYKRVLLVLQRRHWNVHGAWIIGDTSGKIYIDGKKYDYEEAKELARSYEDLNAVPVPIVREDSKYDFC